MNHNQYTRLAFMFVLHAIAMYVLMYAMVNIFANAHPNSNQLYMALLMASPMLLFELLLMGTMYPNRRLNFGIVAAGLLLLAGSFYAIRTQAAIDDEQFLRSMIPHHAGAILMCNEAQIEDPQIRELCGNIVSSQQTEIDWMNAKLKQLQAK